MRNSTAVSTLLALGGFLIAGAAWAQTDVRSGHFTTSDSIRLHYLEAGSGPTLVFVPGWTMQAAQRIAAFLPRHSLQ